jgi:hypothetical protein
MVSVGFRSTFIPGASTIVRDSVREASSGHPAGMSPRKRSIGRVGCRDPAQSGIDIGNFRQPNAGITSRVNNSTERSASANVMSPNASQGQK